MFESDYQEHLHRKLIKKISEFYTDGLTYKEVMNENSSVYKRIKKTYDEVCKELELPRYPGLKRMITWVYTRDEVVSPFGPWIEFDFFHPLKFLIVSENLISRENLSAQPFKFAGFLFTVWVYSLLRKENEDEVDIYRPNDFYFLADIDQKVIRNYSEFSKKAFDLSMTNITRKNPYSDNTPMSLLKIKGFESFNSKLSVMFADFGADEISQDNHWILKRGNTFKASGVNLNNFDAFKKEPALLFNYESKHFRDGSSKFYYPGLSGNPFLRIKQQKDKFKIISQLNLLNYIILFHSLYTGNVESSAYSSLIDVNKYFKNSQTLTRLRENLKSKLDSSVDQLAGNLKLKNVHIEKQPINSPNVLEQTLVKNKGNTLWKRLSEKLKHFSGQSENEDTSQLDHFGQIKEVQKYIWDLNERGIPISESSDISQQTSCRSIDDSIDLAALLLKGDDIDLNDEFEDLKDLQKNRNRFTRIENILQRIDENNRLKGYFKAHGASTHRMTCHNVNLQGLPKYIRKLLYKAPKDYVLVSSDVTGQDIVVAANLAKKVLNDNYFGNNENIMVLRDKIDSTLEKLKVAPTHKPTHHLTSILTEKLSSKDFKHLNHFDEKELKALIKKCIYTKFYGGGRNTFKRETFISKLKPWLHVIENNLIPIVGAQFPDNMLINMPAEISSIENVNSISKDLRNTGKILRKERDELSDTSMVDNMLKIIDLLDDYYKKNEALKKVYDGFFNLVTTTMKEEYPGIIETLDLLEEYSLNSEFNLSYPSLLGWQTVLYDVTDQRKINQQAGSYPVQASGGEFIRQWLIETCRHPWYKKHFYVINVVHDQLLLEVKQKYALKIEKKVLKKSLQRAAEKVGIDPLTIQTETESQ